MPNRSDVLVIGAGPSGAATAIEAARAGARVCVVDRAHFPRPKTCGDAVSNGAARILNELGAGPAFEATARAVVNGAAAIFPDGNRVCRSYGAWPGYIIERYDLDNLLAREIENSGARLIQGVHIGELIETAGRIVGARGVDFHWHADVVVAADGSGSLACKALGRRPPRGTGLGLAATTYYSELAPSTPAGYSEHYFDKELPCGYGWIFPAVNGRANVGVYQRADRYHARGLGLGQLLDTFVMRHAARFGAARSQSRMRTWALPLAHAGLPSAGPGLLSCGDAGRLIDPLTGEGIWHALHSGRLAARAALAALAKGGMDRARARAYQLRCAREVGWPSALRMGIQQGMEWLVEFELYRARPVRALLGWGYTKSFTEVSKQLE